MTVEHVPLCLALLVESVIRDGYTYATQTVDGVDYLTLASITFDADGLPLPARGGAMSHFDLAEPQTVRRAAIVCAARYARRFDWSIS